MEYPEFLQKLRETPRDWMLEGRGIRRRNKPGYLQCPLTAVAPGDLDLFEFTRAGVALNLPPELAAKIVGVADNFVDISTQKMREELLDACGLSSRALMETRDKKVAAQIDGHYCHDWDGLAVSAFTPEYNCCVDFKKTRRGKIVNWFWMRKFYWGDPSVRWYQILRG